MRKFLNEKWYSDKNRVDIMYEKLFFNHTKSSYSGRNIQIIKLFYGVIFTSVKLPSYYMNKLIVVAFT